MSVRTLSAFLLALALGGCDDGGNKRHEVAAAPATASPPAAAEPQIRGRAIDAGDGALAFLLTDDARARDLDALASAVVDSVELSPDGSFAFSRGASGDWILLSAPGKALARVRPAGDLEVRLRPEARLRVSVGEPYACCLVLGARGIPLPLPAEELVSAADGVLTASRLPAGRFTLLVQSADGTRYGARDVSVREGEHLSLSVDLAEHREHARRFLSAIGGAATLHPLHTEESR